MKKNLLIYLMLLFLSSAVFAQEAENIKPWYVPQLGIRGGLNISCKPKEFDDWYWKKGANIGVTADFRLGKEWIFRPGVYYTMKGYKYTEYDYDHIFKFNYLEFPVIFAHQIDICKMFNIELQLGAYFARGINSWVYDFHNHFDWGLNFGLGFNIWHCYLGGAYDFGVMNPGHHGMNQCIMINTGYIF